MSGAVRRACRIILVAFIAGCSAETPDAETRLTDVVIPAGFPNGPLSMTAPADNAVTEARARLGRRLFFDARLSRTGTISCSSCHRPEHGFATPDAVSAGVDGRRGDRNAPALVNLAWSESLFWDGRVATLEEQAGKPIENPNEMDLPLAEAVRRLDDDAGYREAFAEAYAGPPSESSLRRALATFVRTLVSGSSPYDRYLRGDQAALDPAARRGLDIFFGAKGACFHCHPSGALTNDGFFNDGSYVAGGDPGRQAITGRTGDLGKFKVPGLRNVAATAPYMHDGSVPTLEAVIEQYARGGRGGPNTDANVTLLSLSADEKADLLAFLQALTDQAFLSDPRHRE